MDATDRQKTGDDSRLRRGRRARARHGDRGGAVLRQCRCATAARAARLRREKAEARRRRRSLGHAKQRRARHRATACCGASRSRASAPEPGERDHRRDLRRGRPRQGDRRSPRAAASRASCTAITSTAVPRPTATRGTASRDRSRRAPIRRASSRASGCPGTWARRNFTELGLHGRQDRRRAQPPVRARRRAGADERPRSPCASREARAAMIEAPHYSAAGAKQEGGAACPRRCSTAP